MVTGVVPSPPPVLAFNFYRAYGSAISLLVDFSSRVAYITGQGAPSCKKTILSKKVLPLLPPPPPLDTTPRPFHTYTPPPTAQMGRPKPASASGGTFPDPRHNQRFYHPHPHLGRTLSSLRQHTHPASMGRIRRRNPRAQPRVALPQKQSRLEPPGEAVGEREYPSIIPAFRFKLNSEISSTLGFAFSWRGVCFVPAPRPHPGKPPGGLWCG